MKRRRFSSQIRLNVLHTWSEDFLKLYIRADGDAEETSLNFYNPCLEHKLLLENTMRTHYTEVGILDEHIGYHEIENAVKRLKSKKSPGIDGLPNEVITDPSLPIPLLSVFNKIMF